MFCRVSGNRVDGVRIADAVDFPVIKIVARGGKTFVFKVDITDKRFRFHRIDKSEVPWPATLFINSNCHSFSTNLHKHIRDSFVLQKVSDDVCTISLTNCTEVQLHTRICFGKAVFSDPDFIKSHISSCEFYFDSIRRNNFLRSESPCIDQGHNGRIISAA